jgi:predicted metal-dependent phosphoesterase TrpH
VSEPLKIDLHTHSTASDGTLDPAALVTAATGAGITVLALTDHDTTSGMDAAAAAAKACGVTLVPGVEVSTAWRSQAIHVLGLWIDPAHPDLNVALAAQARRRRQRLELMCARLTKARLPGEALLKAVSELPGLPTRTHLAAAMVSAGLVERADQAFKKYLGKGRAAHVPSNWPELAEGISWIRRAGGVAVLAHPARYTLSGGARRRLLEDFKAAGGEAVEVVSGGNGAGHLEACTRMAETHALLGSVGSDFHGPQFAWNPIGRSLKLPSCITPVWRGRLP